MKSEYYSVIDMAHEVIEMHKENIFLRQELEHYKKMHKLNCKSINDSFNHTNEITGIIISAALDPESIINKGHATILQKQTTVPVA